MNREQKEGKKEKPEWEWPFFGSIYGVMCHRTPKQKKRKITEFTRRTNKESEADRVKRKYKQLA
jgi:hypothetical protein